LANDEIEVFKLQMSCQSEQPKKGASERWIVVCILIFLSTAVVFAQEPSDTEIAGSQGVTQAVNRLMQQGFSRYGVAASPQCEDERFIRRIYLDLAGRIPTLQETQQWMNSSRNRGQLIDQLLQSEDFVLHFADLFDAILMGRSSEKKYQERRANHWRSYLEQTIRDNRSWADVVEEILLARPENADAKGAVWFLYERNNDFQKIAESIAPSIFGVRIECAQCHDHMMADEIKQAHYWGLVAFFNRGKNLNAGGQLSVEESAIGGFSDFADLSGSSTPNYLAFLDAETVPEERPAADGEQSDSEELYISHPSPLVNRVPKFSRRERFVKDVVRNHPRLAKAFANRVWAILMGRGLVHPYDEMDSMHQPSHPELLDWLAIDVRESNYDLRRLIRGIVLSDAYQQSSVRMEQHKDPASFAWYLERPLTGEQFARSAVVALRGKADTTEIADFRQQFPLVLPSDFVSTVKDALFMSNGESVDRLINSSNQEDHLIPRLLAEDSIENQVQMLFQSLYCRDADDAENEAIARYLSDHDGTPAEVIKQVVWSMLSSAEFRLNH